MKTLRTLGAVAVTGTVLALLPAGSASAGETDVTFALTGGTLALTHAADATLTSGVTGAATVSGQLGTVEVSDARGTTAGWEISAASTVFEDSAGGSDSTGVTYSTGIVTTNGSVTPAPKGATSIVGEGAPVYGTDAVGNNTASYNPTLTVALPASALAGDYEGTVTTSVA